jgi:protein-tyrosine phosphatase
LTVGDRSPPAGSHPSCRSIELSPPDGAGDRLHDHVGQVVEVDRPRAAPRHDGAVEPVQRLLPLVGAYNFRDLGGYPTVDRQVTRWGQLFRSDTLQALTDADLGILRDVGLASIIDLRTPAEVDRLGRGILEVEPVRYLHLSVIQEAATARQELPPLSELDLASLYLRWLDSSHQPLVDALTTVGDPTNWPLVFHCAAGKDRTGVLAALVLDILGVERPVIVEDYMLTASRLDLIRARQRLDPDTANRMLVAPQLFDVEAQTMETFLHGLHDRYGGARAWALAAGVPPEALETLSALLADPVPEPSEVSPTP